ncbi:MAG TPA: hydroxymethylpyrimidine/phosphomethylpyrimidine kinase [Chromatiales bacterium]|nr:hydroxymethylpyrimidine/phosphomethylpyrimidine kinase [Thiotrichales bacterium]HIP66994.1 hydroxymethylpyrimidine/phosphomethylpyrimidine kinase [Chromatiales bacterium]
MQLLSPPPIVMTFSGLDPTGGAGLQADIEALSSMGCHAAPVATCLTVQDTHDVIEVVPVESSLLISQARAVLEDMPVKAFKIGLLPTVELVETLYSLFRDYPEIPVILDPVLSAGGGTELATAAVTEAIQTLLLPLTHILTPNLLEARKLANTADTLEAGAFAMLGQGCNYVLITGTHAQSDEVINYLYGNNRLLQKYHWPRLTENYHGSGCTLASAIAGLLAQGQEPLSAIHEAQRYTWSALKHGYRSGMGQLIPDRLFWVEGKDS